MKAEFALEMHKCCPWNRLAAKSDAMQSPIHARAVASFVASMAPAKKTLMDAASTMTVWMAEFVRAEPVPTPAP